MSIEISSSLPPFNQSQSFSVSKLSNEQKEMITYILSDYDSSMLSETEAKELVYMFQDAGINPSRDLADVLETNGFDARSIGELAGVPEPHTKDEEALLPNRSGVNQGNLQLLQSILEQYPDISNLSTQEQLTLSDRLLETGLLEPGALIDTQS